MAVLLLYNILSPPLHAQTTDPYYEIQYDEAGKPLLLKHQLIIAFRPELLNKTVINNKEIITGQLQDFFSEEGIYLAQQLGIWNDGIASAPTRKIYEYLSTNDSVSITRTGETINIPKYWATLLVFWPITESKPITQVCDSLRKFYPYIEFAHPNYLYKQNGVPNDPYYTTDQFNLHPSGNPTEGNIDIENAWDIETGSPDIKLGVFDSPIMYTHEDFGGGTLASSKIKGGKVYFQTFGIKDISLFPLTTTIDNHGTNVAGVAAAIRNNEKGIAGIAGGDFSTGNPGVSLYTFGLFGDPKQTNTPNGYCTDAMAAAAITEGANYIPQPNGTYSGYGLHIENHSWGGPALTDNIRRAIKGAARNKCVVVCSRGNDGNDISIPQEGTDNDNYPAVYNDEWVLNVGASGDNKRRLNILEGNTGTNSSTGLSPWSSSYGKKMDVLAPAAQSLMITTRDDNTVTQVFTVCQYPGYCYFVGTSAAAPHVSGLSALLLSKYRFQNGFTTVLEPEDIENLMERNTFQTSSLPNSYSDKQGWGLISPDNTLAQIKDNRYKVYHFTNGGAVNYLNKGPVTLTVPSTGAFGLPSGTYTAEKWQVSYTQSNTFAPGEQILGYWPRLNATEGSNSFNSVPVTEDDWANFSFSLSGSNTLNVTAFSHAYYIPARNQWLYKDKVDIKTAYSVHTFNPLANAVSEVTEKTSLLKAYPNPAQNKVTIELANNTLQSLEVYDIKGALIPIDYTILSKNIVLNTTNLAEGLYVCKTYLNNRGIAINKIIISK